jgi:hypothetical protein
VVAVPNLEELLDLLSRDTLALTLTGTTREQRSSGTWFETRVVMQEGLLRTEEPPGVIDVIVGRDNVWIGRLSAGEELEVRPRGQFPSHLGLPMLLNHSPAHPSYWREWLTKDPAVVMESLRPSQAHGRTAWQFVCPQVKGEQAVITVDVATGLLLRMEGAESGVVAQ